MGKYSLPKVVDSYSIEEICKMKKLQVRPYTISGRCSPDFFFGITDPHEDIQRTGEAVLAVWNERINIAYDHYNQVRVSVLY